jgi:hypothetical protein
MINFRRNNWGIFFNTFNKVSAGANVGFYVMDICNVSENLGGQKNLRRHFRRSYTHLGPQLIGVPYLIYIRNLSVFGRFRISIANNTYQNDIYIDNLN